VLLQKVWTMRMVSSRNTASAQRQRLRQDVSVAATYQKA
ncbi:hypothetical protein ACV343_32790, partial [Pseudomonas aeruginosa]